MMHVFHVSCTAVRYIWQHRRQRLHIAPVSAPWYTLDSYFGLIWYMEHAENTLRRTSWVSDGFSLTV